MDFVEYELREHQAGLCHPQGDARGRPRYEIVSSSGVVIAKHPHGTPIRFKSRQRAKNWFENSRR